MRADGGRVLRVMEWNVENLFDLRHDEGHSDDDFLPGGSYGWTASRYWRKLDEIAKTIVGLKELAVGGSEDGSMTEPAPLLPACIGLCEVENDSVLHDLTQRSALRSAGYRYVMSNSPDVRGVDVALLYQPALFRLLSHHCLRVPSVEHGLSPTRDILYCMGCIPSSASSPDAVYSVDTLHIYVCHFPSKTGGARSSNRHRSLAASTLRQSLDSLMARSPQAKIIVMGDFNATPGESVFRQICPPLHETLPTSRRELNRPIGTYFFQNLWSYLDHILLSPYLQNMGHSREVRLPYLLEKDGRPRRTFKGPIYNGGISDHLPLILDIKNSC